MLSNTGFTNQAYLYIKIGKQILFDKEDLKEWIEKQKHGAISLDSAKQLKEVM